MPSTTEKEGNSKAWDPSESPDGPSKEDVLTTMLRYGYSTLLARAPAHSMYLSFYPHRETAPWVQAYPLSQTPRCPKELCPSRLLSCSANLLDQSI